MPERESAISVSELTRRFGATTALDSVSVALPRGAVYGLVGANGAGKTTLIRHILGLLRAESGSVRVFGLDPVADPVAVLSRIGYLSEENDLPGWMRVDELIRYTSAFYTQWDDAYAEELRRAFALDRGAKIKDLSRGQKARMGLLIALAHRPELLMLDEPSSGLDPIVRRDILGAVIRTIADQGRTVGAALLLPFSWCTDQRPVPMIAFHGTADAAAPYKGGFSWVAPQRFQGVRAFTASWARRNRCGANPVDSVVATDVTRLEYTKCADAAAVVLYTIKGGGHTWPGGQPPPEWFVGRTSNSIDASSLMWAFFRAHRLREAQTGARHK